MNRSKNSPAPRQNESISATAAKPSEAVIFDDVAFTYDGETFVFENLNLSVERGQWVAIVGGNGSGKSTAARLINALLIPDEGTVTTLGFDTADKENTFRIRSLAGMVFQNPDDQLVAAVIENDVAFGPENLGIPSSEIATRVHDALTRVGLSGFETHETQALSGGQKQRVAIAGVLAMEPALLILDEASAMLDPQGRAGLMRVCRRLHEAGLTIVMITHFMDEAALADRIVVLSEGAVVKDGTPREVLTAADELQALSLEAPMAVRISTALARAGLDLPCCLNDDELVAALRALGFGGSSKEVRL